MNRWFWEKTHFGMALIYTERNSIVPAYIIERRLFISRWRVIYSRTGTSFEGWHKKEALMAMVEAVAALEYGA